MALIKCAQTDRLMKDATVLDMADLGRQAERILSSAREEAALILKQATAEAQKLIDSADARGYQQGLERGLEEGRAEGATQGREEACAQMNQQLLELASAWNAALQQWERDRAEMHHQARADVIRFAYLLGERVVLRLVKTDPTIVADQLREALALLGRRTAAQVLVNPVDVQLAAQVLPETLAAMNASAEVQLREDPSVSPGGCVITTAGGRIDAQIETQLQRIAEALVPSNDPPPADDLVPQPEVEPS